jgi:hypothetical protein
LRIQFQEEQAGLAHSKVDSRPNTGRNPRKLHMGRKQNTFLEKEGRKEGRELMVL